MSHELKTPKDLNPRAQPVKQIEMSIRRAYQLNAGLMDALADAGDIESLKASRLHYVITDKNLKEALNWAGNHDPALKHQAVWEWMIDHWYNGGLRRSVRASLRNITSENRKNIEHKVSELHG